MTAEPRKSPTPRLTPMQRKFVQGVLSGLTDTEAHIQAGYAARGRAAGREAWKLKQRPQVAAALLGSRERVRALVETRFDITAERVTQELAKVGFALITDICAWDEEGVRFRPSEGLSEEAVAAIATVKSRVRTTYDKDGAPTRTVELEVKMHPKLDALDKLAKHLGLYQADRENDLDTERRLLETAFWRFVISAHLTQGIPIEEGRRYALAHPEEIEAWGRAEGILKALAPGAPVEGSGD